MSGRMIGTAVSVGDYVCQGYKLRSSSATWVVTSEDDVMSSCSINFNHSFFSVDLSNRETVALPSVRQSPHLWKTVVLATQMTLQL